MPWFDYVKAREENGTNRDPHMNATDGGDRDRIARNPYEAPNAQVGPPLGEPEGSFGRTRPPTRLPAPASQFSIDCKCGRAISVIASQAGSTVRCGCGEEVKVPSLGLDFRTSSHGRKRVE